jgi:hypothetical protein
MERPVELNELLEELRAGQPPAPGPAVTGGKLIIAVVIGDTKDRYELSGEEAQMLLADPKNVERLFEALDYPEDAVVQIHGLQVSDEAMAELEKWAWEVDEM